MSIIKRMILRVFGLFSIWRTKLRNETASSHTQELSAETDNTGTADISNTSVDTSDTVNTDTDNTDSSSHDTD